MCEDIYNFCDIWGGIIIYFVEEILKFCCLFVNKRENCRFFVFRFICYLKFFMVVFLKLNLFLYIFINVVFNLVFLEINFWVFLGV